MRKLLLWIAKKLPRNKDSDYPQLWYCMPRRYRPARFFCVECDEEIKQPQEESDQSKPGVYRCSVCGGMGRVGESKKAWIGYWLKPLLQWLCGLATGHEASKTEWGYGGGKHVDRNCRWCDKVIKVPIAEDPPPNDTLRGLSDLM